MRSIGQSVLQVDNGADTHTRSTMQAARAWVNAGGTLYASGATSLVKNTGHRCS
jgi:hypothetical protein